MTRVWLCFGAVMAAAVLTMVALAQRHPGAFAQDWYWGNHGVGNFAAGIIAGIIAGPGTRRMWQKHRATQGAMHVKLDQLLDSHAELHRKIDGR